MEVASLRFAPGSEGLLTPLMPWLCDTTVSEILINKPHEVYVECLGEMKRYEVSSLTQLHLKRLFLFIANENRQHLDESSPMLSGNLYDGSRVQLIIPPASQHYTLSIRRQSIKQMTLTDYKETDFYSQAQPFEKTKPTSTYFNEEEKQLMALYHVGNWPDFIELAVLLKKNILISGETSSGKTTFLNACTRYIPPSERLITLEDTYEINTTHPNKVALLAPKKLESQEATLSMQDLVQCALRLRPDRLIMGEIRGREIMDFISACSTGHEGSITSIHASNPRVAFMRMIQMYKLNNVPSMRDEEIQAILNEVIDIILQVKKTPQGRKLVYVYYKNAGR
ncbi:MAG: P-type DNA transfer ATPase VirB11 [Legionella sp.]|nr:P-type DNA transfer ATPase VirB11 [Legionella sp.]